MARNEEFKNSALYHGTPHVFNPGDEILPAKKVGKKGSAESTLAYASKDFPVAKFMAWEQNNFNGKNFGSEENPPQHVYRVEPLDPNEKLGSHSSLLHVAQPDVETGYGKARDVTSKIGFRVLSKVQNPEAVDSKFRQVSSAKNEAARDKELNNFRAERIKDPVLRQKNYEYMVRTRQANKLQGKLRAKTIRSGQTASAD